ncbi:MAG: hypothetical protein AB1Z67_03540 [Candidatus Limnocylindrales bacterium]
MHLVPRAALGATPLAVTLTLALAVGASAQVATLVGPDETPEPEAAEAAPEFEDQNEALLAFAQCMRDNGIEMDDPQVGSGPGLRGVLGGGPNSTEDGLDRRSEEFQIAQEACSVYLEASRPELDPTAEQERLEQQLALAQCIRDQGFEEYPDPAIGSDGRLERVRGQAMAEMGIDRRAPEFQAAIGICRDELGFEDIRGFGGGPGAGDGGS